MEIVSIEYRSEEWNYFWIKTVESVDLTKHCARVFIGKYLKIVPQVIPEDVDTIYLCGVAKPFKWANNLHAPIISKKGSVAVVEEKGVKMVIKDAELVPIVSLKKGEGLLPFGNKKEYYTCRNWQYANQIARLNQL